MLVMTLDAVPQSLRGELTRWLIPIGRTAFVGQVSAEVRERLWVLVTSRAGDGQIVMAWSTRGEPGYNLRIHRVDESVLVDLDGVPLLAVKDAAWREADERFALQTRLSESESTDVDT